jgi:hypothetical protein
MADPLTLAALTAVGLAEGIKFLYGQAGELLRRRRERKDGTAAEAPPGLLTGAVDLSRLDDNVLERERPAIEALYAQLTLHGQCLADADPADKELVRRAEALRALLELVHGQRITFRGEKRPASGTRVDATADAERVAGYLAAVRAETIAEGADVKATTRAKDLLPGAAAIAVEANRIGGH